MLTVRRIYLYLVAAISLLVVTWSIIGLIRLIITEGVGRGQITGLASWLAAIIVGLPIFLFHWLWGQRLAARDEEERGSVVRSIFLYGLLAAGATPIFSNIYRLVDNALLSLAGGFRQDFYPYNLSTGEHLAAIVVWVVVWVYLWRQLQADQRLVPPQEANLTVRRLYLIAFAAAGLIMIGQASVYLMKTLLEAAAGLLWRSPVATDSAQLLVGGAIWLGHWYLLQRAFWTGQPGEERSVLRKLYLYLAVFAFSVMAVVSATGLLKRLIELALGDAPSPEPLLSQLSLQLPLMVVGSIFWAYHWYILRQDAAQAPEAPRQAGVRRIYAYLVAAIGLATLVSGIAGLVNVVIDLLTRDIAVGLATYRTQVAWCVAMIVVGIPVWLIPWRAMQRLALGPTGSSGSADERRSTVRKIYLYFYVLVAALAVFGSLGWFVFHILTAILGADLPDDFLTQVLNALALFLIAAVAWLYHWTAIRRDGQLEQSDRTRRLADVVVVVIDGDEGALGQAVLQQLRHDLPGIQIRPVGLTPQAATVMAAPPLAAGMMDPADYIIGSWHTLTATDVAPGVAASPATKLVVPLGGPGWAWAGVRSRPVDYYARQAVLGVKQALNGEEINPGREFDAVTVLAVIGGILLFLMLASFGIGIASELL